MVRSTIITIALLSLLSITFAQNCGTSCLANGCGNGVCDYPVEDCSNCAIDCGMCPSCSRVCGNGLCELGEGACNCTADCGSCCVDGVCNYEKGETLQNCAADCAVILRGKVVNCYAPTVGVASATVICRSREATLTLTVNSLGEFTSSPVAPGMWTCEASAAGFITGTQAVYMDTGILATKSFWLPICGVETIVSGTVKTAAGQFLPGAKVTCSPNNFANQNGIIKRFSTVRGNWMIGRAPTGPYRCIAQYPGFNDQTLAVNFTLGQITSANFVLSPIVQNLVVRVVDKETLQPEPTPFIVTCVGLVESPPSSARPPATNSPISGVVNFNNVFPGLYRCKAVADGWIQGCAICQSSFLDTVPCDIQVTRRPGHINGTVVDPFDAPVGGVTVTCVLQTSGIIFSGSDVSTSYPGDRGYGLTGGKFTIGNVPIGSYICIGTDPLRFKDSAPVSVAVVAGAYSTIKIIVVPLPGDITGLVTQPAAFNFAPVANATVTCYEQRTSIGHSTVSTTQQSPVNYLVSGVAAGPTYCYCSKVGFLNGNTTVLNLESNGVLRVNCIITPILGQIRIDLYDDQTSIFVARGAALLNGLDSVAIGTTLRLPEVGEAAPSYLFGDNIRTLVGGTYGINLTATGYFPGYVQPIVSSSVLQVVPVRLVPKPATLSGTIIDALNVTDKLVGVTVNCTFLSTPPLPLTPTYLTATTNSAGVYSFTSLTSFNNYSCTASLANYFSLTLTSTSALMRDTASQMNFNLVPFTATLNINIKDNNTLASVRGRVCCTGPNGYSTCDPTGVAAINAAGQSSFSNLRVGTYSCSATAPNYGSNTGSFIVAAVQTYVGEIRIAPLPATIRVRVTDKVDGTAIDVASVVCTTNLTLVRPALVTNSTGYITDITPVNDIGPVNCTGSKAGYLADTVTGTTTPNGLLTLSVQLSPQPGTISGYVFNALNGSGIPGAVVSLFINGQPGAPFTTATTDATGFYSVQTAKGTYPSFVWTAAGYKPKTGPTCNTTCNPLVITSGSYHQANFTSDPLPGLLLLTVVDNDNRNLKLPGANVTCVRQNTPNDVFIGWAISDANGIANLSFVPGGQNYNCSATKQNYNPSTTGYFPVNLNETKNVNIILPARFVTVTGYIFNPVTFQSFPGVEVFIYNTATNAPVAAQVAPIVTKADGSFSFTIRVPTEPFGINTSCTTSNAACTTTLPNSNKVFGALNETELLPPNCCGTPTSAAGQTTLFNLPVNVISRVTGYVTLSGIPQPDVPVQVYSGSSTQPQLGSTDKNGYYAVTVTDGQTYYIKVAASATRYTAALTSPVSGAYPAISSGQTVVQNLTLISSAYGNISGSVKNATNFLDNFLVTVYSCTGAPLQVGGFPGCNFGASLGPIVKQVNSTLTTFMKAGAELNFDVTGLPANSYYVCVSKPGFTSPCTQKEITVTDPTPFAAAPVPVGPTFRIFLRQCLKKNLGACYLYNQTGYEAGFPGGWTASATETFGLPGPSGTAHVTGFIDVERAAGSHYLWCASTSPGYMPDLSLAEWQTTPGPMIGPNNTASNNINTFWITPRDQPIVAPLAKIYEAVCTITQL